VDLLVLHGLPGVGKLTVAREVSRITGFRLFHNHLTVDLLTPVFEFGSPPFVDLREEIWLSVFGSAARERVPGLVFTFVFEKTVREGFLDAVAQAVVPHGGRLLLSELRCDRHTLEERIVNPGRRAYGKLKSVETLNRLLEEGALETPELRWPNLVLDTTALSPPDVAKAVCSHYGLGGQPMAAGAHCGGG